MEKQIWRPGNMLYPLPAVLVSCADEDGTPNVMTAAWTGTVCSDPVMVYVSIRPNRYSNGIIRKSGEFVINLTTEKLAYATDYCGVKSGRDVDKFAACHLTAHPGSKVKAPLVAESPVNLECVVTEIKELGSHDMFLAKVVAVQADAAYLDEKGRLAMEGMGLLAYSHGEYYSLGEKLGTFGYSVRKKA
ncbi:MAG: flavin reductase family protein [Lachnospiraceae bacterium]|nr:flavin reductase family protein [Lachnospiraceae bacterium]MBR4208839.1 flavin reductase family protein [Lachnospiraceae bacterium]